MKFIRLTKAESSENIALLINDITEIEASDFPRFNSRIITTKVWRGKAWVQVKESFDDIYAQINAEEVQK